MVFILPGWPKNQMMPEVRKYNSISLLIFCCVFSAPLPAKGISIDWVNNEKINDKYMLNAKVSYSFSEEVLDALEHGVALYFNVEVKTSIKRQLLWDKTISMDILNYRLEYHPLSQRYLLTDYKHFKRHDFRTLDAALENMGNITDYPIANVSLLTSGNQYVASIRVLLDNKSLPAPLRPLSFISSDWQLSSPWTSMDIQP